MYISIRQFKNNDELIKELEERNLQFPDENSKKIFKSYLSQYGYFSFVKKMSHVLMYENIEKKEFKKEFTSNDLRYLFDIDRNISVIIFKYFRNIEFLLNSSILKVVAKKLNKKAKCPYLAALDNEGLIDIFPSIDEEIPFFKKRERNTFANFYEDIFKNFNNIDFDSKDAIEQNQNKENIEIKKLIDDGWFKNFINSQQKKKNGIRYIIKDWEYLDIFSLFQTFSFFQLHRIFSYLSISSKNEIIKEFFNDFKLKNKHSKIKEKTFNKLLELFSNLRNILMHNGCLIKFNLKIDEDTKNELNKFFDIKLSSLDIKLNEAILIMELIINIKNKIFNEIIDSVHNKFKNRTSKNNSVSSLILQIIEETSRIQIYYNDDDR